MDHAISVFFHVGHSDGNGFIRRFAFFIVLDINGSDPIAVSTPLIFNEIVEKLVMHGTRIENLGNGLFILVYCFGAINIEVVEVSGDFGAVPSEIGTVFLFGVPKVFAVEVLHGIAGQHAFLAVVVVSKENAVFEFVADEEFVAFEIEDGERTFEIGVVSLAGVIPAVVPDEAEAAFEQRHVNNQIRTAGHRNDGDALAVFGGHADGCAFPAVATVVMELEDDIALLADEYLAVSGAADAGLVGDIDGVFIKARFEAVVVVGHGGTHFGIGQFGNDFRIAA